MREVEIEWNGVKGVVKLRELTFGEYIDIMRKYSKNRVVNGVVSAEIDVWGMKMEMVLKSIVEAPFEVNMQNLRNLSTKYAQILMEVVDELNSFPSEEPDN